jgi:fibronectin type 3 domain-containing protein
VRAYHLQGATNLYGLYSDVKSAKPAPTTTSLTAASASYTSVKLSWPSVSGATGYEVWRSTSSAGAFPTTYTVPVAGSTDTSLTTGTTYYYKVRAYHLQGSTNVYGGFSDVKSAKPVPATTSLSVASAGYTSVQLGWASVSGATGYEIYRATSATGTYTRLVTVSGTSYRNTGLTTGTTYYYKTRAYHLQGSTKVFGSFSAIQHAKPVPGTISGLSAAKATSSSVAVKWSAVSGATGYEIYRATSATGTYARLVTVSGTSYRNTGLTTGRTYYYKTRAYHLQGSTKVYGAFSVAASATL